MARQGVKVVIATHSVNIIQWLEVHLKKHPNDEELVALNQFPVSNSTDDEDFKIKMANLAQAGQATVLTTSMVHGGSTNIDNEPRKVLVMTYTAAGVAIGLPENQAETKRAYDAKLLTSAFLMESCLILASTQAAFL